MSFFPLKGEVLEVGESDFDGNKFPFAKVLVKLGAHADLSRVSLAKTDVVKVGDKVDWIVEVKLAENERGKGRMSCKKAS